jgi:hypothetical protein
MLIANSVIVMVRATLRVLNVCHVTHCNKVPLVDDESTVL